jgi:hypothetical protein
MNENSLLRKIAYVAAIVLLLVPLFALGRPGQGLIGRPDEREYAIGHVGTKGGGIHHTLASG